MLFVVIAPVVVVCHSNPNVMKRFLFKAQDLNMTNGDYAFITFSDRVTDVFIRPWIPYDLSPEQLDHRKKAFYAVKQVI